MCFVAHWQIIKCSPWQAISPGIVETEFAFRLHSDDPEKAAATYANIKVWDLSIKYKK